MRKDRADHRGGGVAIVTRIGIPNIPVDLNTDLEATANKIWCGHRELNICNIYLPPDTNNQTVAAKLRGPPAEIGSKTVFHFEMDFLKNDLMDFVVWRLILKIKKSTIIFWRRFFGTTFYFLVRTLYKNFIFFIFFHIWNATPQKLLDGFCCVTPHFED